MSKPLKNVAIPTSKRVRTCHLEKGIRSMRAVMDVVETASTPLLVAVILVLRPSLAPIGGILRQQFPSRHCRVIDRHCVFLQIKTARAASLKSFSTDFNTRTQVAFQAIVNAASHIE